MTQNKPSVLVTICARGGSQGVPKKNIRPLLGKPLLAYTIECAQACGSVDRIVISTDSKEIAATARSLGVSVPFLRPDNLATSSSAKVGAIRHATQWMEDNEGFYPDLVVDLDVSAPLRPPSDITAVVETFIRHEDLDGVVSVYEPERNPYFNMVEMEGHRARLAKRPEIPVVRRQDAPKVFSVSGSIFAWRREALGRVTHLYEGVWGACEVPRENAVDIDTEMEFQFVEFLLRKRAESEQD